jgi:hypothetical protein
MKKLSSNYKRKIKMIPDLSNLDLIQEYQSSSSDIDYHMSETGLPCDDIFQYNIELEEEILRRMN